MTKRASGRRPVVISVAGQLGAVAASAAATSGHQWASVVSVHLVRELDLVSHGLFCAAGQQAEFGLANYCRKLLANETGWLASRLVSFIWLNYIVGHEFASRW